MYNTPGPSNYCNWVICAMKYTVLFWFTIDNKLSGTNQDFDADLTDC